MTAGERAVQYAISELACENVKPDIEPTATLPELELELVYAVSLYRGKEVADETKRLFEIATIG
jgi:hypothetical protein